MAAGKKTGGRQKGTPNKALAAREAQLAASGLLPLDYMLGILRDESQSDDKRAWAAEKAAPYVHPKLASVEHSGKDGGAIKTVTRIELIALKPNGNGSG